MSRSVDFEAKYSPFFLTELHSHMSIKFKNSFNLRRSSDLRVNKQCSETPYTSSKIKYNGTN